MAFPTIMLVHCLSVCHVVAVLVACAYCTCCLKRFGQPFQDAIFLKKCSYCRTLIDEQILSMRLPKSTKLTWYKAIKMRVQSMVMCFLYMENLLSLKFRSKSEVAH